MIDFTKLKALTVPEGEVAKIEDINGNILWKAVTGRLPSEYQEVEWIGTDGNSWFISDFTINELDDFTLHYRYCVPKATNTYMFGANEKTSSNVSQPRFLHRYLALVINTSKTSGAIQQFHFAQDNAFYTYRIVCKHEGNITVYKDGTQISQNTYYNAKVFNNFGVFCNNYNSTPTSYKAIKDSKISELRFVDNATGQDVFNPVPCYRKSDGVIGMYDTVKGKFYTNQGTGAFTKGADVSNDKPLQTNLADPTSEDWWIDKRVGSDGTYRDQTGCITTNYIEVRQGDVIRVKGMDLITYNSAMYNNLKNIYSCAKLTGMTTTLGNVTATSTGGQVTSLMGTIDQPWFIRFCGVPNGSVNDIIITKNEEIN